MHSWLQCEAASHIQRKQGVPKLGSIPRVQTECEVGLEVNIVLLADLTDIKEMQNTASSCWLGVN